MENLTYPAQIAQAYARMAELPPDPWRPAYHLSPLSGTLADPDGLCQVGGVYHIFYVTNPLGCLTTQRTSCVWGHYSTRDFVHYRRETTAIFPDTARDRDGVYSGSALVDGDKLYLYYTGNVRHHGDFDYIHAGREQNVLRVESADGVHFTVRTPEPFGYMWECPDYACLNGQQLLLCSPQGIPHQAYEYQNAHQCGCLELTGRLDAGAAAGAFHSFDYGFDFYAVRSLRAADGRTLLIAWMGMSEADYGRTPAAGHGWDQVIALPRELTWENGRPCQRPLRELRALRGECQAAGCDAGAAWDSRRCELVLHPQPGQDVSLHLFEDGLLSYDAAGKVLTLDLSGSCGAGRTVRRMKLDRLDTLDLFLDGSALEAFVNDGEAVLASRIFGQSSRVAAAPFAGRAEFYPMRPIVIEDCREHGV